MHLQVSVEPEVLVAVRLAAGFDFLPEATTALDLESADTLVPLVELDLEANDVLGLFELVGDLALVVVEFLATAPTGRFAPVLISCERGSAAGWRTAFVGRVSGVVRAGPLGNGSGLTRVLEGCTNMYCIRNFVRRTNRKVGRKID